MPSYKLRLYVMGQSDPFVLHEHESYYLPRLSDWLIVQYGTYQVVAQVWRVFHWDYPVGSMQHPELPTIDLLMQQPEATAFLSYVSMLNQVQEEVRKRNVAHLETKDIFLEQEGGDHVTTPRRVGLPGQPSAHRSNGEADRGGPSAQRGE